MKTFLMTLAASLARTFADVLDPPQGRDDAPARVDALHDELRRVELELGSLTARFDRHEDDRTHRVAFDPSDTLCSMCNAGTVEIVRRGLVLAGSDVPMTVYRCAHCGHTSCASNDYFDTMPKRVPLGSSEAVVLEASAGDATDDDTEPT
mgnify:CR=1 FL=1